MVSSASPPPSQGSAPQRKQRTKCPPKATGVVFGRFLSCAVTTMPDIRFATTPFSLLLVLPARSWDSLPSHNPILTRPVSFGSSPPTSYFAALVCHWFFTLPPSPHATQSCNLHVAPNPPVVPRSQTPPWQDKMAELGLGGEGGEREGVGPDPPPWHFGSPEQEERREEGGGGGPKTAIPQS